MHTQLLSGGWAMQLDKSREHDLDYLYAEYRSADSSRKKKLIEKVIDSIMTETGADRRLRDELIKAARVNDRNRMDYIRNELRRLQAEKYYNHIQL